MPLLAINADDDPIVRILPEEEIRSARGERAGEGGNIVMVVTNGGGHLGWFTGKDAKRRWISRPIAEWLRAVDEEIVWAAPPVSGASSSTSLVSTAGGSTLHGGRLVKPRKPVVGEDGFTRADGERADIGYRVLAEDEIVPGTPGSASSGAGGDTSVPGAMAGL